MAHIMNPRIAALAKLGDADAIAQAIHRVAAELETRMPEGQWSHGYWARLAHECTADLPAVEL